MRFRAPTLLVFLAVLLAAAHSGAPAGKAAKGPVKAVRLDRAMRNAARGVVRTKRVKRLELLKSRRFAVQVVEVRPGGKYLGGPPNGREILLLVSSGRGELVGAAEKRILGKGDVMFYPDGGMRFLIANRSKKVLRMLRFASPRAPRRSKKAGRLFRGSRPAMIMEIFKKIRAHKSEWLSLYDGDRLGAGALRVSDSIAGLYHDGSDVFITGLRGTGTVTVQGRPLEIRSGEFLWIPRGTPYSLSKKGREKFLLAFVSSPPASFLKGGRP